MKNTNLFKIIFDIFMLILLVMVYAASATGLIFHEIVGLLIFALFAIHLYYNRKWIIQVGKRIFDKAFNRKQKFMYVLNLLSVIMFIVAGVSGIMISKIVFKLEGRIGDMFVMRYVHVCSAVLSVILIGIHIGIHWKMIIHTVKTNIHISAHIGKALVLIMAFAIFGISAYGIIISATNKKDSEHGPAIQNVSVLSVFEDVFNVNRLQESWSQYKLLKKMMAEKSLKGNNNSDTGMDFDGGRRDFDEADGRGGGHGGDGPETHEDPKFQPFYVMVTSIEYLSVLLLMSMATYLIEKNINRKNRHPIKD